MLSQRIQHPGMESRSRESPTAEGKSYAHTPILTMESCTFARPPARTPSP